MIRGILATLMMKETTFTFRVLSRVYYMCLWATDSVPETWDKLVASECFISDDEVPFSWNALVTADAIHTDRKFVMKLDGLNELDPAELPRMVSTLKDWVRQRSGRVKICIYSCGEKIFQDAFGSYPGYDLNGVSLIEMAWYVHVQRSIDQINAALEKRFDKYRNTNFDEQMLCGDYTRQNEMLEL
ncbi:uncharacterized protein BO97DRAFT_421341 [Aspergillus homomorphus CBS 101889]|uniref:Uncharacterized protein n=1 Tax=Aspergillus homomorphus (strain CBS 101889) TaxID=1450537 RepID=A0A395I8I9_ASPHC|nr:hypothetical protein BO97DRAFT_421341 [Aspergillus homomorphus CBS 101889]RAL16109.1 hypothetical protein BO97DRAFT_421341 [Aspergillus homomorphus CBS 101889]